MAFVRVLTTEGRELVIHTSQLGGRRPPPGPKGEWPDVWARMEGNFPEIPESSPGPVSAGMAPKSPISAP